MRDRQQLDLTPSEYHDAKQRERRRILKHLTADLERARDNRAPWYQWIVWRRDGVHQHELRDYNGKQVSCPVPGCDGGRW